MGGRCADRRALHEIVAAKLTQTDLDLTGRQDTRSRRDSQRSRLLHFNLYGLDD